ncbi:aspartic peptidase domain-containing protein [Xylariomycetidae sp. FL2044]|nr:aspartic peptidase domain-containing protein [Xylariomycetidae sp. FL2044]
MRYVLLLALAALAAPGEVEQQTTKAIRWPMRKHSATPEASGNSDGADNWPFKTNLSRAEYSGPLYTIDISIGQQPVTVALDTGSHLLWVNPNCSAAIIQEECYGYGAYDPQRSSTSQSIDCEEQWLIWYGLSDAYGCYYIDDIRIAGAYIWRAQFGVASDTSMVSIGIIGLGFGNNVSTLYNTVLDQMVLSGLVPSRQYSLALGGVNASGGEIVFSGVDLRKYTGDLYTLPIIYPGPDNLHRFWVNINSVAYHDTLHCEPTAIPFPSDGLSVVLDSGTSHSYLPPQFVKEIASNFADAQYYDPLGGWLVACSYARSQATINIGFGYGVIKVPVAELIMKHGPHCYLGVLNLYPGDQPTLGSNILSSAYVLFDLDKKTVYIAQYQDCGSLVVDYGPYSSVLLGLCDEPDPITPATCTTRTHSISHVEHKVFNLEDFKFKVLVDPIDSRQYAYQKLVTFRFGNKRPIHKLCFQSAVYPIHEHIEIHFHEQDDVEDVNNLYPVGHYHLPSTHVDPLDRLLHLRQPNQPADGVIPYLDRGWNSNIEKLVEDEHDHQVDEFLLQDDDDDATHPHTLPTISYMDPECYTDPCVMAIEKWSATAAWSTDFCSWFLTAVEPSETALVPSPLSLCVLDPESLVSSISWGCVCIETTRPTMSPTPTLTHTLTHTHAHTPTETAGYCSSGVVTAWRTTTVTEYYYDPTRITTETETVTETEMFTV